MFRTCLHCHSSLGENQLLEQFPIGRRLAFDSAKGRLWVVCMQCRRWNLTPIEERWEVIEECERLYGATPLRASTDNIGLARLADGLEVVRIGAAKTPEMAAWRYAGDFRRRWLRKGVPFALVTGGLLQGANVAMSGGQDLAMYLGAVSILMATLVLTKMAGPRATLALPTGEVLRLPKQVYRHIRLEPLASTWQLSLGEPTEPTRIKGSQAVPALRAVMTARNSSGAPAREVEAAIAVLSESRDPERFISRLARASVRTGIRQYPSDIALALEMALHEDSERRALEGELYLLRDEWELAEEIARIADSMFLSDAVLMRFQRLKEEAQA